MGLALVQSLWNKHWQDNWNGRWCVIWVRVDVAKCGGGAASHVMPSLHTAILLIDTVLPDSSLALGGSAIFLRDRQMRWRPIWIYRWLRVAGVIYCRIRPKGQPWTIRSYQLRVTRTHGDSRGRSWTTRHLDDEQMISARVKTRPRTDCRLPFPENRPRAVAVRLRCG